MPSTTLYSKLKTKSLIVLSVFNTRPHREHTRSHDYSKKADNNQYVMHGIHPLSIAKLS
jgi:hypothetical protein